MERITPSEQYYKYFSNQDKQKFEVAKSLSVYLESEPGLKDELAQKDSITLLLLGSATPRNPQNLVRFLEDLRPRRYTADKIIIEEISDTAIDFHRNDQKESDIPVYLTKMDMREMAIQPKAVDLLIADFTLNFVSSLEDVNNFFREIRESLKEDGIALVSVSCNRYFLDQEKYGRYQENIPFSQRRSFSVYKGLGTKQWMFTLPQYIEIAQNNGLSVAVLARKDNEKIGPQFFLKIKINHSKKP